MISTFPYPGKKTKILKHILPLIPDHKKYIEPFAGGLAVFLSKEKSKFEVINDLDLDITIFYRCVRYHKNALLKELENYFHNRKEFENLVNMHPVTELQRASRFYVTQCSSFGGHGRNWGRSSDGSSGFDYNKANYNIDKLSDRLRGVYIENNDFEDIIKTYAKNPNKEKNPNEDTFIYCDPPYLTGKIYKYKSFKKDDMIRLKDCLEKTNAKWLLSCDGSKDCKDIFKDHYIKQIDIIYNIGNKLGKSSKEFLVMSDSLSQNVSELVF